MKGEILLNGKVVVSDVEADVYVETRRGLKEWRGSFSVDDPATLSQNEYQLELDDGRAGRILITRKSFASGPGTTLIQFTGTGPLRFKDED